jgi:DNA-directed RNA polymerase I subunit RPA43
MAPVQPQIDSLLHIERISQYVSLSPACLATPLPALCASIFSPLLLSYFPPARGVVLGYEDVQLSGTPPASHTATSRSKSQQRQRNVAAETETTQDESGMLLLQHVDEYSAPFLWATASFLVFRPVKNASLSATLTHQSASHITLSHLNTFPISVVAAQLPSSWTWHSETSGKIKKGWDGRLADEGGWWVDGEGVRVEQGRGFEVRVRDFDGRMDGRGRGKGFLRLEGSLLAEGEEGREKGKRVVTGVLRKGAEVGGGV